VQDEFSSLSYVRRSIGLVQADSRTAAGAFSTWLNEILEPAGIRMESREVRGDLSTILPNLLPIDSPLTKSLFIPSKGTWTVLFENGPFGADAGHVHVLAERLKSAAMSIVAMPVSNPNNYYGAVIWEVCNGDGTFRRTLYAMDDGGRWDFYSAGDPFEFEDLARYSATRIRDRFTIQMLEEYLAHMEIFPLRDDWFREEGSILVERIGGYLDAWPAEPEKIH
jgi:hypothetical protein